MFTFYQTMHPPPPPDGIRSTPVNQIFSLGYVDERRVRGLQNKEHKKLNSYKIVKL